MQVENNYDVIINNGPSTRVLDPHYREHGPYQRPVFTVVWAGAREHGQRTRASKLNDTRVEHREHGP